MHAKRSVLGLGMAVATMALLVGFATAASAQVATGSITGTITDAKGAAMAGVTVTVHNADTGIDLPVKTNNSGVYAAPLLQPGNYDVTAAQSGFATVQNKNIVVQVGTAVRIDIQMPIASQQSLVTVTTEAPLIETEKTEASQVISEGLVADLPTASRRWEQFALLTPGVVTDGAGKLAFHGINSMYNTNSVDGASNDQMEDGTQRGGTNDGYTYSADSIKEFQVASSNFNAEIGHSAGGAVNAVTKSGTNSIHGDLFENLRNPVFDALDLVSAQNSIALGQTPTQPVLQQNQFGGSVGGPILKDELFYFVTYDGYRKVTPINFTTSQINPTISALACPLELTAVQCTAAKNFVVAENLGSFKRLLAQDIGLGKIGYQLNQSNHFDVIYNWRNWVQPFSTAYATVSNSGFTSGSNSFFRDRFMIASWDKVIGSDKVNELRYQYSQDNSFLTWQPNVQIPATSLSNIFGYGESNLNPNFTNEHRHQLTDNFSFTKGRHTFKTGVDLHFIHVSLQSAAPSSGSYSYSSAVALPAASGCPASGSGLIFCDWLVDLYGVNVGDGKTGQHWTSFAQAHDISAPSNAMGQLVPAFLDDFETYQFAGYFQDTWKVRSNLTLNLGLRYDVQLLPGIPFPNTTTAIDAKYSTNVNTDFGGIQPRVGLAWNFAKKNVLRADFGIFVAGTNGSEVSAARRLAARGQTLNCTPGAGGPCAGLVFPDILYEQTQWNIGSPFTIAGAPAAQQPLAPAVLAPAGNPCLGSSTCIIAGLAPNLVNPRVYEGEVAFERQLPGNMSFSASYELTNGQHLPGFFDENLASPTLTKTYDVVNSSGVTQSTSTVPFFTSKLDPTTGGIDAAESFIYSWYNAMILTLRMPKSHGLSVLANYTLSKAEDLGEGTSIAGGEGNDASIGVLNPYDLRAEYGISSLDVPNRFTIAAAWAPPYAKNLSNGYEKGVLNGWNLSTSVTVTNGNHYNANNQSSAIPCAIVASPCPAADMGVDGGMTGALLSNRSPLAGRVTFLPRGAFALPNYSDVDLRIDRQFTLHERYIFEFRAEAFNLFNSTIVQAVNATAYSAVQPSATSATCRSASHTNTCMVPVSTFGSATTTSNYLLGARQLQFGFRFSF